MPLLAPGVRLEVMKLLTPESLKFICGIGAVYAASHWIGVGEIADIVVLGIGTIAIGAELVRAGHEFQLFYERARKATTAADLDGAAQHFANGVSIAGINTLIVFLAKSRVKLANAGAVIEALQTEASAIRFAPCFNGALWSKLKPIAAEERAIAEGLVTLEGLLKSSNGGFYAQLTALTDLANRNMMEWKLLEPIWRTLSRGYAASLRGRVVAYVDLPALNKRIATATATPFEILKKQASSKKSIDLADNPIVIEEIDVITDHIFQLNPSVTSILVKDVNGRMGGFIIDRRYGTTH